MTIKCDVLIVGAGPAGLATAITTSGAGLKTILVEKNSEIGYPVKTSAFTWRDVWEKWKLSENVVYQKQNSLYLNSVHSKRAVEVNFKKIVGGVLDHHIFLRELVFKAIKNNTKILLSQRVIEPLTDGTIVIGVKTSKQDIQSKIVVDCSGPEAIIAKKMGVVSKNQTRELGIGMEYEMKNVNIRNPNSIDFYVGKEEVVPISYGWVFPTGLDSARVGVATIYNAPEEIEKEDIKIWLDRFLSEKSAIYKIVKDAQPFEMHMGAYLLSGMISQPYSDGLLVVGDAAAQASMLLGEGIRYALEFGVYAGETAVRAVSKKDISRDMLSDYAKKCNEYLGETYEVGSDLLQVPTDEYWEALIDNIIRLKKKGELDLILDYFKTAMDYKKAIEIFPEFKGKYLK
jgi:digeranylgeranylglycerophospholipid reductase